MHLNRLSSLSYTTVAQGITTYLELGGLKCSCRYLSVGAGGLRCHLQARGSDTQLKMSTPWLCVEDSNGKSQRMEIDMTLYFLTIVNTGASSSRKDIIGGDHVILFNLRQVDWDQKILEKSFLALPRY